MADKINELRDQFNILACQVREKIFALFCLTVIAIVAMLKLADPENIVINVIVGICSFVGGVAVGQGMKRKTDPPSPPGV